MNNSYGDSQPFLNMTILPDIESQLNKAFTLNRLKHIVLVSSYLAKILELREPYVRIVLAGYLTQIFDDLTDDEHPVDNTLKYADIPEVAYFFYVLG